VITPKFITSLFHLGKGVAKNGLGAHGNHYMCDDVYEEMLTHRQTSRNGKMEPNIHR
jgi:nitrate reductase alpha subunit